MIPKYNSSKNWTEDYEGNVGGYINTCLNCKDNFFGHKRRIICRECVTIRKAEPTMKPERPAGNLLDNAMEWSDYVVKLEQYAEELDKTYAEMHKHFDKYRGKIDIKSNGRNYMDWVEEIIDAYIVKCEEDKVREDAFNEYMEYVQKRKEQDGEL